MKFYGIDAQGYIKIQQTSGDNPPTFVSGSDERRLIYVHDTINNQDRMYLGGDEANDWSRIVFDDGSSYATLTQELGNTFHPTGGASDETFKASIYSGADGENTLQTDEDWIYVGVGDPVDDPNGARGERWGGILVNVLPDGDQNNDAAVFYDGTVGTDPDGKGFEWKISGPNYSPTEQIIATREWVDYTLTGNNVNYYTKTGADTIFVRYDHDGSGSAEPSNETWKQWYELTAPNRGTATAESTSFPSYPTRQIFRKNEAYRGFVRVANWGENDNSGGAGDPASQTARYASVSTVNNTIVQRSSSGDIYANIGYLTATSAQYADLAEKYTCDETLPVGTVVKIADDTSEYEVVPVTSEELTPAAIGVVSAAPAYLMNSESAGLPIALTGRVPVRIVGAVSKGEFIVPDGSDGCARKGLPSEVAYKIGVALETDLQDSEKLVECIIK